MCVVFLRGKSPLEKQTSPRLEQEEGVQFEAQSDQMLSASNGCFQPQPKRWQKPHANNFAFPLLPPTKTVRIKKDDNSTNLWTSFGFCFGKQGSKGVVQGVFQFLSPRIRGDLFCHKSGEPPTRKPDFLVDPTRHAENAAALLENVLGTQGSGWYGSWLLFYDYD